jgi:hypothetical protein
VAFISFDDARSSGCNSFRKLQLGYERIETRFEQTHAIYAR